MTGQEALRIIDRLLEEHQRGTLKTIQAEIVLQVWEQNSYYAIGNELGYDPDYIKQVAAQLWKLLSEIVGEKVSKGNLCSILQRYRTSFAPVDWGRQSMLPTFMGEKGS
jgi:hypothetical protein